MRSTFNKEQDPGDRLYGCEIDAAGNHPEADQQSEPVGDTRIHDDDGQKTCIPERKAFAVAHRKSAVYGGEYAEESGNHFQQNVNAAAREKHNWSSTGNKPRRLKTTVKKVPLAIHDVLHALVKGGIARQKRQGFPR